MTEHVTTVLELVGLLLLVAALAAFVAPVSVPLALVVAGAGLLGVSLLLSRFGTRR